MYQEERLFISDLKRVGLTEDTIRAYVDFEPKENQKQVSELVQKLLLKQFRTLLISGNRGTGKTYVVSALLARFLYDNPSNRSIYENARYIYQHELDMEFKSCMSPGTSKTQMDVYNYYCNIPILVIEEVGRASGSDFTMQNLENIIIKRYANKLRTVLITNKTASEIKQMFDAAVLDRIANQKDGISINLGGESLR